MNLDDLRALLEVARSGSVSKAAVALSLTQPAVARRVQRLEASVGVALLNRGARPLALTRAGRNLVARLPKLFAVLDELQSVGGSDDGRSPRFRLGLVTSLADRITSDVVGRFRGEFPRLTLAVVVGWTPDLLRRLCEAQLDAAVIYVPDEFVPPPDVELRVAGRVPLVAVGPRMRARHDAPDDWILNASGCCFRDVLARVLSAAGLPLRVGLEVEGIDRQLRLVAGGAGRGFVAAPLLHGSSVRSQLRLLHLPAHGASIRVAVIHRQDGASAQRMAEAIGRHLQRWLKDSSRLPRLGARSSAAIPRSSCGGGAIQRFARTN